LCSAVKYDQSQQHVVYLIPCSRTIFTRSIAGGATISIAVEWRGTAVLSCNVYVYVQVIIYKGKLSYTI
jgi:hypothetical protein